MDLKENPKSGRELLPFVGCWTNHSPTARLACPLGTASPRRPIVLGELTHLHMAKSEETPLMARSGSRSSSLDEEECAEVAPPEPEVDSNLLRRAGRILAFGIVATVIILLGVVGHVGGGDAVAARVELGVPHQGMAVGNVVRQPNGALAHKVDLLQTSSSADRPGLTPEENAHRDTVRARRQSYREERRRRKRWDMDNGVRGDLELATDDDMETDDEAIYKSEEVFTSANKRAAVASLGRPADGVSGVSLNGWLQLEEWFFSMDGSSLVDASAGMTNGAIFPPAFPTPESLGFEWASEGDLASKLSDAVGEEAAVAAFVAHREAYFSGQDVIDLKKQGYGNVRLPLTWAAFASEPDAAETMVTDPAHANVKQVTVSRASLNRYVRILADAGLQVVVDVHTMPGGSSEGTYNGVFPNEPKFWDDEKLMTMGRGVVREMLRWYLALPDFSRRAIKGFTLLNEPAHLLPDKKETMLDWYAGAVEDYRTLIAEPAKLAGEQTPRLLVNFIDTCGMNVYEMAQWMGDNFSQEERATWAVLDTHMYLAWEHPAPGTWQCDAPLDEIREGIFSFINAKVGEMNDAAERNGIEHTAVSEWSLATHHDSREGCQETRVLETIRDAQASAFKQGGVESYFWGWKMPDGGTHQKFWSARFHDQAVVAANAATSAATGVAEGAGEPTAVEAGSTEAAMEDTEVDLNAEVASASADADVDAAGEAAVDVDASAIDAERAPSEEKIVGSTTELPTGFVALSVHPGAQGDGRVSEMRAAADRAAAEVRAAADRAAAAEAVKRATAEARAAGAGTLRDSGAVEVTTPVEADDATQSLDVLASEAAESLEMAYGPVELAVEPVVVAVDPVEMAVDPVEVNVEPVEVREDPAPAVRNAGARNSVTRI